MCAKKKVLLLILLFVCWLIFAFAGFQFSSWFVNSGYIQIRYSSITLSAFEIFILSIFVYPFLEEIIFRLPLRINVTNVALALIVATWYYWFSYVGKVSIDYKLLAPLVITTLILIAFFKTKYSKEILFNLKNQYYIPFVITSALIFAMAHFGKIEYDNLIHALLFIAVMYFSFGLFVSYVRVKFNFWIALSFHVLQNSIPYLIVLYYSIIRGENLFQYV